MPEMLAYVFWHWPNADQTPAAYEDTQRAFHAALAHAASQGFVRSYVFRVEGQAAWLGGAPAYADWYLVEDSAALDPLNVAAVSGVCEAPHAAVAQAMSAGAGSLFTLRGDTAVDLTTSRALTFLTKPKGAPYPDFYATIPSKQTATLWRRTMVLGPTPEFALLTPEPPSSVDQFHPQTLALTRIWPT
jgi:hypothetical protein